MLKPDHLCFFLSRCRKSKDENNGSIRFSCLLSDLVSVHCCHLCCRVIFIYILLIYIFLQGIKQTHRHDEFIVLKHIKGSQGEGRQREGEVLHSSSHHMICPLLETGFLFFVVIFCLKKKKKRDPAPGPGLVGRYEEGGEGRRRRRAQPSLPLCHLMGGL